MVIFLFLMKNELSCLRVEKQSVTDQRKQENWKLGILNNKSWKEINQLIDHSVIINVW